MSTNRLFFCINSGRSGSEYLSNLLSTSKEVVSFHEPEPTMTGKYLHMINEYPYSDSYLKRMVKEKYIRKTLRSLNNDQIYCETSHMFIKTYFDIIVNNFHNVEIIFLRRELSKVLKSFIELGYFSELNDAWSSWMTMPNSKTSAIACIDNVDNLDQVDLCIAYLIDIEARGIRFLNEYPDRPIHNILLDDLNVYKKIKNIFYNLGITETEKTKDFNMLIKNKRSDRKKIINNEIELDYCKYRIELYTNKALKKGINIPETLYFNK